MFINSLDSLDQKGYLLQVTAPSSMCLGSDCTGGFPTSLSAYVKLLSLYETVTAREPVAMGYCLRISKPIYPATI